jgi:hypothetical protein
MKILSAIAGGVLRVAGVAGSGVGVFALIDPRGTQMSNDADPFGAPPSVLDSSFMVCVYLLVAGVGAFLLWRSLRKPPISA